MAVEVSVGMLGVAHLDRVCISEIRFWSVLDWIGKIAIWKHVASSVIVGHTIGYFEFLQRARAWFLNEGTDCSVSLGTSEKG
jgi:hypothetical protein